MKPLRHNTIAMLANPVNRAIVAFVRQRGAASTCDIATHLQASGIPNPLGSRVNNLMGSGVLVNTTPRGAHARYVLGTRAAWFLLTPEQLQTGGQASLPEAGNTPADDTQADNTLPADDPPARVGTQALPAQYDVMRAPVWVPPPMGSTRPGADDHRACPSRGHGC